MHSMIEKANRGEPSQNAQKVPEWLKQVQKRNTAFQRQQIIGQNKLDEIERRWDPRDID